ncbi:MAG TPA: glycine--tRNA ligase subunit beta, partial [Spirochaetota bacterium]|nr:glycine--tRNA ligase subunit beta [Spirochaetota bacterium]
MLQNANFLCEIGTEEIPAGYLPPAIDYIKKAFGDRLREERIAFDAVEVYATPRRIAIMASGVASFNSE